MSLGPSLVLVAHGNIRAAHLVAYRNGAREGGGSQRDPAILGRLTPHLW